MKMKKSPSVKVVVGLAIAGFLFLSAESCDTPNQDRANKQADSYGEATNVKVWLNADEIPTVATFCADNLAWASTLSSDGAKTPTLLRVPEHDSQCGAER